MDHAKQQAESQSNHISALMAALGMDWDRLEDLKDERSDLISATQDPESDDEQAEAEAALRDWDAEFLKELDDLIAKAGEWKDWDEVITAIQGRPLSVESRNGWTSLGDTPTPEEFRIVLCTGGPHVEIMGEFDIHGQPYRAWLQYQDWGTPMTQYFGADENAILDFCREFYWGE